MDKEKRARVDEAKRELDDILRTLIGAPCPVEAAVPLPMAVFSGTVHIHRLVMCPGLATNDLEEPCE